MDDRARKMHGWTDGQCRVVNRKEKIDTPIKVGKRIPKIRFVNPRVEHSDGAELSIDLGAAAAASYVRVSLVAGRTDADADGPTTEPVMFSRAAGLSQKRVVYVYI